MISLFFILKWFFDNFMQENFQKYTKKVSRSNQNSCQQQSLQWRRKNSNFLGNFSCVTHFYKNLRQRTLECNHMCMFFHLALNMLLLLLSLLRKVKIHTVFGLFLFRYPSLTHEDHHNLNFCLDTHLFSSSLLNF